jgi:hypothetical protein
MNDFETNSAHQAMNRYFPDDIQRFLYSSLKPGTFHIWYGTGNNGKSVLSRVVANAIHTAYGYASSFMSGIRFQKDIQKAKVIIVDDYDSVNSISADKVLNNYLVNGSIIILLTNTLPLFTGEMSGIWNRLHVIPFKNVFPPASNDYTPNNLLTHYIAAKMQDYNAIQIVPPNAVQQAFDELRLLNKVPNHYAIEPIKQPIEINNKSKIKQSVLETEKGLENLKNNTAKTSIMPAPASPTQPTQPAPPTKATPPVLLVDYVLDEEKTPIVETKAPVINTVRYNFVPIVIEMYENTNKGSLTINADSDSDDFVVSFNESSTSSKAVLYITADKIYHYIQHFFRSIEVSAAKYSTYKFSVPGFPTVVILSSNLRAYVTENFIPQMDFLTASWPIRM